MNQAGEDMDSRDLSYKQSGNFFLGAAGLDLAIGSRLAVTGAVRYGACRIVGAVEEPRNQIIVLERLPGPLREHLSYEDKILDLGLFSFEVGLTFNPGGTLRDQTRWGR
ncbi:hypothetical protein ACGF5M_06380 [Gemmatimonadota bacterium]